MTDKKLEKELAAIRKENEEKGRKAVWPKKPTLYEALTSTKYYWWGSRGRDKDGD